MWSTETKPEDNDSEKVDLALLGAALAHDTLALDGTDLVAIVPAERLKLTLNLQYTNVYG